MDLNVQGWKEFSLDKLFDIMGTVTTKKDELEESGVGPYPYVTTAATNNGIDGHYSIFTEIGNVLCVDSACLGYTTYQPDNFSASDHVEKLTPKFNLNAEIGMFFASLMNKECDRFNYGRKCSQIKLKQRILKLPIQHNPDGTPIIDADKTYSDEGYIPDWQFMEDYIKSLHSEPITTTRGGCRITFAWC